MTKKIKPNQTEALIGFVDIGTMMFQIQHGAIILKSTDMQLHNKRYKTIAAKLAKSKALPTWATDPNEPILMIYSKKFMPDLTNNDLQAIFIEMGLSVTTITYPHEKEVSLS